MEAVENMDADEVMGPELFVGLPCNTVRLFVEQYSYLAAHGLVPSLLRTYDPFNPFQMLLDSMKRRWSEFLKVA